MSLQTENGMLRAEDVPDVVLEELGSQLLRFAFVFGVIIIACAVFVAYSLGLRDVPYLLPETAGSELPEEVDQVGF